MKRAGFIETAYGHFVPRHMDSFPIFGIGIVLYLASMVRKNNLDGREIASGLQMGKTFFLSRKRGRFRGTHSIGASLTSSTKVRFSDFSSRIACVRARREIIIGPFSRYFPVSIKSTTDD